MKFKYFPLALLFMLVGHCFADVTVQMTRTGNTQSDAFMDISTDTTNRGGGALSFSKNMSLSPGVISFVAAKDRFPGVISSAFTSASPRIEGAYNPTTVDINDTKFYNNQTYYRLKGVGNANFPLYIRLEQYVFLPSAKSHKSVYVDIRDLDATTKGDLGWYEFAVQFFGKTRIFSCPPKNRAGTYDVNVVCDDGGVHFTMSSQYTNRNVIMKFYMPKTPYATITIPNNILVGQSKIKNMCIDQGDDDSSFDVANNCTNNAAKTDLINYYMKGELTFKTTCSVSDTTKTIELASTSAASFAGKGQGGIPAGITPKETSVSMSCSGDINSSFTKGIVWTMTGVGESLSAAPASQGILLAKGMGISNLGVRVTSDSTGKVPVKVDGTQEVAAAISGMKATAKFYSYPTAASASSAPVGAGAYQAMATLSFYIP